MSPILLPALAAATALCGLMLRRFPRAQGAVLVGGLGVLVVAGMLVATSQPSARIDWGPVVTLSMAVTGFSRVMVVLIPLVAAPIVAYAALTESTDRSRLLVLMTLFVAAMLILVTAADFITLLIGWELVGATSWALIGHGWRDRANVSAATEAFITTRLGDVGLYVAAGATFAATGSFAFDGITGAAQPWPQIVAAGVLLAAAAKSAQLPFSPWLFSAMAGPTPVSALLHSATLVAAGAYLLIRLAPALEAVPWLAPAIVAVGLATALAGGVLALVQRHGKRLLAASTSAQYGLMFVAVGAGSTAAAGAQLVAHALFKSLLFLVAGIAMHATSSALLARWRLGRAIPGLFLLAAIGSIALAGVPLTGGGWSKEEILASVLAFGGIAPALISIAAFLSAAYATRFLLLTAGSKALARTVSRPPARHLVPLAVLGVASLGLSLLWLPSAGRIVESLTGGPLVEGPSWQPVLAVGLIVAGATLSVLLDRAGRLEEVGGPFAARPALQAWLGMPTLTGALIVRPITTLSLALATADDRVIDAGIRATDRLASALSSLLALRVDVSVDRVVRRIYRLTLQSGTRSRELDEQVVDGAVEGSGRAVGMAGERIRGLQTGQSHEYFVIGAVGLVAIATILALGR